MTQINIEKSLTKSNERKSQNKQFSLERGGSSIKMTEKTKILYKIIVMSYLINKVHNS